MQVLLANPRRFCAGVERWANEQGGHAPLADPPEDARRLRVAGRCREDS
jgi:hypothetical protein